MHSQTRGVQERTSVLLEEKGGSQGRTSVPQNEKSVPQSRKSGSQEEKSGSQKGKSVPQGQK